MSRLTPFELNAFDSVGAGQKAHTKLPTGPTYQEVVLISNVPPAKIDKVTVDLGGIHQMGEIIEMTGAQLVTLEKYKGVTVGAGPVYFYVVPFGQRDAKTDAGQWSTGLVTLPNDNVLINVYLNADLGGITPYIKGHARASKSQSVRYVIPMMKPHSIIVTSTGDNDYMGLPSDPAIRLRRLWLKGGDISKVELWKDGTRQYEQTLEVTEYIQKREEKMPQPDYFVLDFVQSGWMLADVFSPARLNELKMRMKVGTVENIQLLVEGYKVLTEANAQR